MLSKEEKKAILDKVRLLKEEIINIRKELNSSDNLKENSFKKYREIHYIFKDSINKIKSLKSNNDSFNSEVENLKDEREKYNSIVKDLINKIKVLEKKKEEFISKNNIKVFPSKIKEQIEALESSIETEAYTFDKEKKVMKRIKDLKGVYNKSSILNNVLEELNKVSQLIDENRSLADNCHKKVLEIVKENKKSFDDIISMSKEIQDLRKQKDNFFEEFKKHKLNFSGLNNKLKEKLLEISSLQWKLEGSYREFNKSRKERQEELIKEKAKLIEEKIGKKQKLTTEDLIFFQGSDLLN